MLFTPHVPFHPYRLFRGHSGLKGIGTRTFLEENRNRGGGGNQTKRYIVIAGVVAIIVVLVVVFLLSFLNPNEGPEDVVRDIVKSVNEGDARGVVDHTVSVFSPSDSYESRVNATRDAIDYAPIVLSNISIGNVTYSAGMNESEREQVTDYVFEYQTRLVHVVFEADDYCVISFSWDITRADADLSWTEECEWLLAHIEDDWYVVGTGLGGVWG